ncbi:lipopolysaccharide biosynthesis protein [Diplocloster agilis]|uniref:Polysaccharide biosynthesis protein n=1 Tax=Diplocloster agilis TaxID=2850323 RepID=A0A949NAK5_9FIRM|nr:MULTISPECIES: hypothetical protein [Lachnospiraceae]MBU9736577.1 hypothetical protein [Diplocloster agilis]MCU6735181.1 hypothetical protein [Suonthocola fibrivorans]SCJ66527.1 Uncharacterised protein [uncultured Clostridium sp.]
MIKKKNIALDLAYCIIAVGIMNLVLQLIVYPIINGRVGEASFGNILYFIGVMNILSPAFGLALNNTRLVTPNRERTENYDYVKILSYFSLASVVIVLLLSIFNNNFSVVDLVLFSIVIILALVRNYSSVEYRLSLNYKRQMNFYLIISIGYLGGLGIWYVTRYWQFIFILGEAAALFYIKITGRVFNLSNKKTSIYFKEIFKSSTLLAASYLLTYFMCNLDRFVLLKCVNSEAVSQYYVLSLLGKTIAIISGPINSIVIGYLTKDKRQITKNIFLKCIFLMVSLGGLFWIICSGITPIYIKILYPNLYTNVLQFNLLVNLAQILYFITNILLVVVLTICSTKWQFWVQGIYAFFYLASSIFLSINFGLYGYVCSAVISNLIYFILAFVVGYKFAGRKIR